MQSTTETTSPPSPLISRESLQTRAHATQLRTHLGAMAHLLQDDAALDASLRATLMAHPLAAADTTLDPSSRDVWLFGYGSLIWNPLIHFIAQRVTTIRGYHRKFCLFSRVNRGSPALPGLVLGLDRGGACTGVAYRIAAAEVWKELSLTWRREMMMNSYRAIWCAVEIDGAREYVLTFAIDRAHPACACALTEDEVVDRLARATGLQGSSAEYLYKTAQGLHSHGIVDLHIEALAAKVKARIETLPASSQ